MALVAAPVVKEKKRSTFVSPPMVKKTLRRAEVEQLRSAIFMPSTTPVAEHSQMAGKRMAAAIRTATQTKAAEERAKKARDAALKGRGS